MSCVGMTFADRVHDRAWRMSPEFPVSGFCRADNDGQRLDNGRLEAEGNLCRLSRNDNRRERLRGEPDKRRPEPEDTRRKVPDRELPPCRCTDPRDAPTTATVAPGQGLSVTPSTTLPEQLPAPAHVRRSIQGAPAGSLL